MNTEKERLV